MMSVNNTGRRGLTGAWRSRDVIIGCTVAAGVVISIIIIVATLITAHRYLHTCQRATLHA